MTQQAKKAPKRIARTVIGSLRAGVVPRVGLEYIAVGRRDEIAALLDDAAIIADGGASFRFIVGRYGSGKSFMLQIIRNYVMDRGFIVVDADLSPERRLVGSNGQGLATYRELITNLATKTRPEGGALALVLDRWVSAMQEAAVQKTGLGPDDPGFGQAVAQTIRDTTLSLGEMVHGFDFARLLTLYWEAFLEGDEEKRARVLKWFRGEYPTKTEARRELGVGVIISDDDWYDYLKLFARFFRLAGYAGMLVCIDELVNVYKIVQTVSRQKNYEKILTMYNDTLQGKAQYLGIIMSGTPQCVEDRRKGIYSYEALRSRLADGRFGTEGRRDMLSPVIKLDPLTPAEMLVLCEKLAAMHADLFGGGGRLDQKALTLFVESEYSRVGARTHITPREIIRDFIELLDLLVQHPETTVAQFLQEQERSGPAQEGPDAFADFEL